MKHVKQAIKDASANGGYSSDKKYALLEAKIMLALFEPNFWQALGKARGWERWYVSYKTGVPGMPEWQSNWHRFVDHLADGKDAESFFAAL